MHLTDVTTFIDHSLGGPVYEEGGEWGVAGSVGWLWEDAISRSLKDRVIEMDGEGIANGVRLMIGEEVVDEETGILMTPDAIELNEWALWEFKACWKSVRRSPPSEIRKWRWQVGAYCRAVHTRVAYVVALYVCGNYSPPAPQIVVERMEFTKRELDENWKMITNGLGSMRKARGEGKGE